MYIFIYRDQFTLRDDNGLSRELQLAKWSPTGHALAIVDHYNIFYIKNITEPKNIIQLTFTGEFDFYNGIPDWVYEGLYVLFLMYCISIL